MPEQQEFRRTGRWVAERSTAPRARTADLDVRRDSASVDYRFEATSPYLYRCNRDAVLGSSPTTATQQAGGSAGRSARRPRDGSTVMGHRDQRGGSATWASPDTGSGFESQAGPELRRPFMELQVMGTECCGASLSEGKWPT